MILSSMTSNASNCVRHDLVQQNPTALASGEDDIVNPNMASHGRVLGVTIGNNVQSLVGPLWRIGAGHGRPLAKREQLG